MAKQSNSKKQSWRRVSPNTLPRAAQQLPIDRAADWIGKQTRPIRSFLAAFVALTLAGTAALLEYNYLVQVEPGNPLFSMMENPGFLLVNLIILAVLGLVLYWIGWRLMIGFDSGDTPLKPGRAAAVWLLVGFLVFI